jgi:hypothetical protein
VEAELIDLRPRQHPSRERPRYEPTPAEIAAACAEIQREWSDDEEYRRRAFRPETGWQVHEVRTGGNPGPNSDGGQWE